MKRTPSLRIAAVASLGLLLSACQQSESPTAGGASADAGKQKFAVTCATCHGADGEGVKGLGKALRANAFLKSSTDADLAKLITEGRQAGDPLNTTGVAMPPKGGNPALAEADIKDIIAFVRTLQ